MMMAAGVLRGTNFTELAHEGESSIRGMLLASWGLHGEFDDDRKVGDRFKYNNDVKVKNALRFLVEESSKCFEYMKINLDGKRGSKFSRPGFLTRTGKRKGGLCPEMCKSILGTKTLGEHCTVANIEKETTQYDNSRLQMYLFLIAWRK